MRSCANSAAYAMAALMLFTQRRVFGEYPTASFASTLISAREYRRRKSFRWPSRRGARPYSPMSPANAAVTLAGLPQRLFFHSAL
jgi:hypothetical protein